ncbi:MAG: hypothetical protein DRI84_10405 [Bacteroidetes bacterium]|nr:MAG: hypothetical protein DRI84_10405 [Bacteroidota bacterium]
MVIKKNCSRCKGTGKVENQHGKFKCPECEYRDLFEKAIQLKLDKYYPYESDRHFEMERLASVFHEPTVNHSWHIELYVDHRIRRVDFSWMKNNR